MPTDDKFEKAKGETWFRKGSKPRWIEIEVRQKGGKVIKLIARPVDEFYSERQVTL